MIISVFRLALRSMHAQLMHACICAHYAPSDMHAHILLAGIHSRVWLGISYFILHLNLNNGTKFV